MPRAAVIEVRAHGEHHGGIALGIAHRVDERADELDPFRGVVALRERLLELVDRDEQTTGGLDTEDRVPQRRRRMMARPQHRLRPALAAREHPVVQLGEETGTQ